MSKKPQGKVIIPPHINVLEHEIKTAQALAGAGYDVSFIPKKDGLRVKSADVLINDVMFEMKSPKSGKLSAVERNLKRASHQSANIVFDSRRMKNLRDINIQRILIAKLQQQKTIKNILFINKDGKPVDIRALI